eukprot:6423494-Karenia_brevis.AAC.1
MEELITARHRQSCQGTRHMHAEMAELKLITSRHHQELPLAVKTLPAHSPLCERSMALWEAC